MVNMAGGYETSVPELASSHVSFVCLWNSGWFWGIGLTWGVHILSAEAWGRLSSPKPVRAGDG